MSANIINGKEHADFLLEQVRLHNLHCEEILKGNYTKKTLAVITSSDDPASEVYVRQKKNACEKVGFGFLNERVIFDDGFALDTVSTTHEKVDKLIYVIKKANETADAIIVQLPLPRDLEPYTQMVLDAIDPNKDVDGLTTTNKNCLFMRRNTEPMIFGNLYPCTPLGIVEILRENHLKIMASGNSMNKVVIIGRSQLVGLPLAKMLLDLNCTVSICHSQTLCLKDETLTADVIICAAGHMNTITADMVKPGAVVIDVGINRGKDGKLHGDCSNDVRNVAGWITPVPGGVGPMTVAELMLNITKTGNQCIQGIQRCYGTI